MKLQVQNFFIEMKGEDVKLLHNEPKPLDLFIAYDKLNERRRIGNYSMKINGG